MLAAVILSGGASTRMGAPKALLPYQGRPFLDHLLEATRHPKISARRVVLGPHAEPIARAIHLDADEIVINPDWEKGQITSIQAALKSLPPGLDGTAALPRGPSLNQLRLGSRSHRRFLRFPPGRSSSHVSGAPWPSSYFFGEAFCGIARRATRGRRSRGSLGPPRRSSRIPHHRRRLHPQSQRPRNFRPRHPSSRLADGLSMGTPRPSARRRQPSPVRHPTSFARCHPEAIR